MESLNKMIANKEETQTKNVKKFNLITTKDIEKLKKYKERILPSDKAKATMFYIRFRTRFLKTIEVLADASSLLPEKEKNHVLTSLTLNRLIDALLTYDEEKESKNVKNERAFMIAYLLALKGEAGFDMVNNPYNLLLDDPCKTKRMRILMELTEMKFKSNGKF